MIVLERDLGIAQERKQLIARPARCAATLERLLMPIGPSYPHSTQPAQYHHAPCHVPSADQPDPPPPDYPGPRSQCRNSGPALTDTMTATYNAAIVCRAEANTTRGDHP
jgi:hypothetical protein